MITTRILGIAVALVGASALSASADDKLTLDELPEKVKAAVEKHVGAEGTIEDIEREKRMDKVVYEVEYKNSKGHDYEIWVNEDGKVIGARRE